MIDPNDAEFTIYLGALGGTPTMRMLVTLRSAFECGAIVGQRREAKAVSMAESAVKAAEAAGSLTAELREQTDRVEKLAGFAAGKVGDRN